MRAWVTAAVVAALGAPAAAHTMFAEAGSGARAAIGQVPPALVGAWTSEPDRMRLVTDFEKSVWGDDASSVRTVELTIGPSGEGTLTVSRKIVDAQGQPKPASVSVEAVQLRVGEARGVTAGRIEHAVEVVAAERRYPDDPEYRWPLDGVRVRVVGFEQDPAVIEIRFDTPEGRGSFWEKLHREGSPARLTTRADPAA